ncbi:MAG: hypothetical protein AB1797_03050 [bacterium]
MPKIHRGQPAIGGVRGKEEEMNLAEEILEEDKRVRRLRIMVDLAGATIKSGSLSRPEAERLIEGCRKWTVTLFPEKGYLFDLIYRNRLERLIEAHLP